MPHRGGIVFDWVFSSIQYLDFDAECLLIESFAVGQLTYGGISYSDLRDMSFDDYCVVIKRAQQVKKELDKDTENE